MVVVRLGWGRVGQSNAHSTVLISRLGQCRQDRIVQDRTAEGVAPCSCDSPEMPKRVATRPLCMRSANLHTKEKERKDEDDVWSRF